LQIRFIQTLQIISPDSLQWFQGSKARRGTKAQKHDGSKAQKHEGFQGSKADGSKAQKREKRLALKGHGFSHAATSTDHRPALAAGGTFTS
jgi:hypothetical protein